MSLWPSKQSLDLFSAFLASVHKFAPKQGHWNLLCPHPVLAPQAPEPHPSIALTLVFPGLDWHSPYFGRGGLFLDYAGSPLINLQARWTEKRVSAPGKYTKQSHPPSRLQPRVFDSPRVQDSCPTRLPVSAVASPSSACHVAHSVPGVAQTTLLQHSDIRLRSSQAGNTTFSASLSAFRPNQPGHLLLAASPSG